MPYLLDVPIDGGGRREQQRVRARLGLHQSQRMMHRPSKAILAPTISLPREGNEICAHATESCSIGLAQRPSRLDAVLYLEPRVIGRADCDYGCDWRILAVVGTELRRAK